MDDTPEITVKPATRARWKDVQSLFGTRGEAAKCQCQRAILPLREYWHMPREVREAFFHKEIARSCAPAPGLIAYAGVEPVGWCRLGPRAQFAPLRNSPVSWAGREEDKDDTAVWALVCFVVRTGHRRQGISQALVRRSTMRAGTARPRWKAIRWRPGTAISPGANCAWGRMAHSSAPASRKSRSPHSAAT